MGDAALIEGLGPITESRFREAFATTATLTAKVAADLIGLDVDTLGDMTDAGLIRAVPKGRKGRAWTERDLRAFLIEGPNAPPREHKQKGKTVPPRSAKVVPFTARKKVHA